jgi:insulin-like growth factor 2 receptor
VWTATLRLTLWVVDASVSFGSGAQCSYTFTWRTSAACALEDTSEPELPTPTACDVVDVDNAVRYDLTALARPKGSWVVVAGEYLYAINVCEPVQGISLCGTTAGACQLKPGNSTFAKNMGVPARPPELTSGTLVLHYSNGDACHNGASTRSTTILFSCDERGRVGQPAFVQETEDCEYVFAWTTAAACPEKLVSPCQLSVGAQQYDLHGLQRTAATGGKNFRVDHTDGFEAHAHEMVMNVCGKLLSADSHCREGVTVCEWEKDRPSQSRSLGTVPALTATSTGLLAVYTDGDLCETGGLVTTLVNYICDASAGIGKPKYGRPRTVCVCVYK